MKKSLLFLGVLSLGLAHAQQDVNGKVGVNIEQPKATLDIAAHKQDGTTKEGILIPRFEKAKVVEMTNTHRTTLEESTLLYVTDEVAEADKNTFEGTGKGFYYFDKKGQRTADNTARWVKVGSGAAAAATAGKEIKKLRTVANIQSTDWRDDDHTIVITDGSQSLALPDPAQNKDRIIVVRNGGLFQQSYTGNWTPTNNSVLNQHGGNILQSDGTQWWNISSF